MYRRIEVLSPGETAMMIAANAMVESGLPDPRKRFHRKFWVKRRCRFFFTEMGWRRCGHHILSEVRKKGFRAKIVALKERDPRLNIYYEDPFQILASYGGTKTTKERRTK
jgi:hypothetical protein